MKTQPPTQICGSNRFFIIHFNRTPKQHIDRKSVRLCATFMVSTAKQCNWHKEIGKTCEILPSYAPTKNGVEKETFTAYTNIVLCSTFLSHWTQCTWTFLAKQKKTQQNKWNTEIVIISGQFSIELWQNRIRKLVHANLPTDFHFNVRSTQCMERVCVCVLSAMRKVSMENTMHFCFH